MSNAGWDDYPHGAEYERRQLNTMHASASVRLPYTWTTIDGELIEMARMKNSHLRNTIEMLRRTSLKKLSRQKVGVGAELDYSDFGMMDLDARAHAAYGDIYDELVSEALQRSEDGDLEKWLQL